MRIICWTVAHTVVFAVLILISFSTTSQNNWLLFVIPISLGLVQLPFLARQLRWWSWLWVPVSYLGLMLSFAGGWWFFLFLGWGIGLAQSPLLLMGKFQRVFAWSTASGIGWGAGVFAGGWLMERLAPGGSPEAIRMAILYSSVATIYGLATACALHVMESVPKAEERVSVTKVIGGN